MDSDAPIELSGTMAESAQAQRERLKALIEAAIPDDAHSTPLFFALRDVMVARTAAIPLIVSAHDAVEELLRTCDGLYFGKEEPDEEELVESLLDLRPAASEIDDVSWVMFAKRLREHPQPARWWAPFVGNSEDVWSPPDSIWDDLRDVHREILEWAIAYMIENPHDFTETDHAQAK